LIDVLRKVSASDRFIRAEDWSVARDYCLGNQVMSSQPHRLVYIDPLLRPQGQKQQQQQLPSEFQFYGVWGGPNAGDLISSVNLHIERPFAKKPIENIFKKSKKTLKNRFVNKATYTHYHVELKTKLKTRVKVHIFSSQSLCAINLTREAFLDSMSSRISPCSLQFWIE